MGELGAIEGDSLDAIFATYRQAFIKQAERIVGCRSQAEDIVHDAFLKIIADGRKYNVESRASYMMKIVRNLAIDHYRRKFVETRLFSGKEERAALVSEPAQPDSINMHRQILQVVASALSELPERTRYAFEAGRIQGVSQKEIAVRLSVSPTLVNFMIRDALVHCRQRVAALAA
jgi:RNA polymerase sigma factor (sigma-70 family)